MKGERMRSPLKVISYTINSTLGLGLLALLPVMMAIPAVAREAPLVQGVADARAELNEGRRLYEAGQYQQAVAVWQPACGSFQKQGDYSSQALCSSYLSLAYQELSAWEAAQNAIDQSLEILQSRETDAIVWAQALNTQARLFLGRGQSQQALETWQRSEELYKEAGDIAGALGSQINQAGALQNLGFYRRSRQLLQSAAQQLQSQPNSPLKATALRSLGITLQVVGDDPRSQEVLQQSLAISEDLGTPASATLLALGNTALDLQQVEAGRDYFQRAIATAANPEEKLEARLNLLSLYVENNKGKANPEPPKQETNQLVAEIYSSLGDLPPSRTTVYAAVNLANNWTRIAAAAGELSPSKLNILLSEAVRGAKSLGDEPAQAYALLAMGHLYEGNSQWQEALSLTEKSLGVASSIQAADIASQSAWQLGRILKKLGKEKEAIAAYAESVSNLQSLRGDLVAINPDIQFSFRESVEPIYREMVALLLDANPSQENLIQARELIENLQLAELDNFFREACLDATPVAIDEIDPTAAVIYPIILPDRLAVIVSSSSQPLRYYFTRLPQVEIENALEELLSSMSPAYAPEERLPLAQQLYDWLIRPAQTDKGLEEVKTLVFVLDGKLRNLPMAILHDGEGYLVEKYNIALSQGLQLLASEKLAAKDFSAIAGGLTQARQGFSELPAVESEIKKISGEVPASIILDGEFTRSAFANEIDTNSANVVHLATHGQFSSQAEETFLLAWDGRINVKELDELLARRETTQAGAIELLVLSACETAVGDERAVLGLAGMAVRSGARSTLATLWAVRDQSTAILMTEFYKQLRENKVTKAEALRNAQLALLRDPNYEEPFFWAPFILVGSWL